MPEHSTEHSTALQPVASHAVARQHRHRASAQEQSEISVQAPSSGVRESLLPHVQLLLELPEKQLDTLNI